MANTAGLPSRGRWIGDVKLGNTQKRATFEVFPSGGCWSLLMGKPILQQLGAIHNYKDDTLRIPYNDGWQTLLSNTTQPNDDDKKETPPAPPNAPLQALPQHATHLPRPIAASLGLSSRRECRSQKDLWSIINEERGAGPGQADSQNM